MSSRIVCIVLALLLPLKTLADISLERTDLRLEEGGSILIEFEPTEACDVQDEFGGKSKTEIINHQ